MLFQTLAEDYDSDTNDDEIAGRPWYGRCVWDAENDVCDDQFVTITWEDDPLPSEADPQRALLNRGAKTANFHMIAQTEKQCERRGRIYGTKGEIAYDSKTITVYDFATESSREFHPHQPGGGHGGGDAGLARQFVKAIDAVKNHGVPVADAQAEYVGCTLEEIIRSHAFVFAAEEARREKKVVDWSEWWKVRVETMLRDLQKVQGADSPMS